MSMDMIMNKMDMIMNKIECLKNGELEEIRKECEDECGFTPFPDSKRIEKRKMRKESKYRVLKAPENPWIPRPTDKYIRSRAELTERELEMLNLIEKAIGRKLLDEKKPFKEKLTVPCCSRIRDAQYEDLKEYARDRDVDEYGYRRSRKHRGKDCGYFRNLFDDDDEASTSKYVEVLMEAKRKIYRELKNPIAEELEYQKKF